MDVLVTFVKMHYFLEAFGVGCFLSIMIGPVFFLLLEISITKGIRAALLFDLGVLLSDVFYIFIALFFAFQVRSLQDNVLLGFIGGGVFVGYGFFQLVYKKNKVERINLSSDQEYNALNTARGKIKKKDAIVDIDLKTIKVEEEIDFSINVKELVRILNWSRFELLIFYTSVKDVEGLLTEYDKLGCLQGILDIKEHYSYYLDTIIK